jgi:hypothetical protein
MKPISMIAATVVSFALISYSIAIITEQIAKILTNRVLVYLTLGLGLDITGTTLMVLGSRNTPFTLHGFIGYSSLSLMIIETYLIWKLKNNRGMNSEVPRKLHIYSRVAYIWWIMAYFSGAMIAAMR